MSKLSTPALALDGEQLTISNIDDNATSVQLKRGGSNYKNLFSIDETYTNVTASTHDSMMAADDLVIISITADGTNYKVPTTAPTVTGCTSSYTRHTDTYAVLSLSNPTSNISFTVVGEESFSYPSKGDLITMTLGNSAPAYGTNNLYRVMSITDSVAEVMAMYDYVSTQFSSTGTWAYSGKPLDVALNQTFYNSLNTTAKNAIVDKDVNAYKYTYTSSAYNANTHASYAQYSSKTLMSNVGSRHVYALDIADIETYFNNTFSKQDIWTLFYNTTSAPSYTTRPWLISAISNSGFDHVAWYIESPYGYIEKNYVGSTGGYARPALTIDLSLITWTKVV